MKGVGGPLLCVGDFLSDLAESEQQQEDVHIRHPSASPSVPGSDNDTIYSADLTKLFQENYSELKEALAGTDHSWTTLTLKLCNAMETANKLVRDTSSNVRLLSENVAELQKLVKRGDAAVAATNAVRVSLNQKGGSFGGSLNVE